jgi:hypothetical protein
MEFYAPLAEDIESLLKTLQDEDLGRQVWREINT